ncbi:MAG: glycine oxidase ThiO [Rhodospirillales bacterium]|nr:glycine oxidase ThiO [Rhodospirillales bacterium]
MIGAGVCGLSIGWRLASAGCQVNIYERGKSGRAASWAAAGMLAAGVECEPGEENLLKLTTLSQKLWPKFLHDLSKDSKQNPEYRNEGTLVVAINRDDATRLEFTYNFQKNLGINLEWLDGYETRKLEPHLNPSIVAGVYSSNDHQINNRLLMRSLEEAFVHKEGIIHEYTEVTDIETHNESVKGIIVDGSLIETDVVIIAAGAWSNNINGLTKECIPPVRPVKGQMLSLSMEQNSPLLKHVIWAPNAYLVPRNDGSLLVGATIEENGFNPDLTAGGIFSLLEASWRVIPNIEELPIKEMWAGFRPTSRDDAPILGATKIKGLVMATGHHRNGILLAPVTANAVSELILNGETTKEVEPFSIERFNNNIEH